MTLDAGDGEAPRPVEGGTGSIVIPAHDEERVIARCLTALFDGLPADVEVVVAANGCTDATVETAKATGLPVTVLDLPEPGKIGALNAGEAAVHSLPRIYLDADVVVTGKMADAVLTALRDGAVAARPPVHFDTSGASPIVRSFYRARVQLPTLMHELCIGGVYSLSASARARFDRFPEVVADDLFVGRIVSSDEVTIVDTDPYVVRVPSDARSLLKIMRRSFRGNHELATVRPEMQRATTGSNLRDLVSQMTSPRGFADAVIYAAVVVTARLWARWRPTSVRWERDDSSRQP
jgi:glycosyltransferase involved in cell wall biosynthesis